MLAGVGVIADVTPATGALYAKFAKVFKPSKLTTKGVSNGFEQVIKEGVDATKSIDGIATDLDTAFGKTILAIDECSSSCTGQADNVVKAIIDRGIVAKDALKTLEQAVVGIKTTPIPISCFLGAVEEMKATLVSGAMTVRDITLLFFGVDLPQSAFNAVGAVQTRLNPSTAVCPYGQLNVNIRATVGSGPGGRGTKLYDGIPVGSTGKPEGTSPHHIVPLKESRAARCIRPGRTDSCTELRARMTRYGIDLNDGDNGVFLPYTATSPMYSKFTRATLHDTTVFHQAPYYVNLNDRLVALESSLTSTVPPATASVIASKIRDELQKVAFELLEGTFNILTYNSP